MTTDSLLLQKREDLKRRLASGEYKTLVDVLLEWFERLVRKVTRHGRSLPRWVTSIILILAVSLMGLAIIYLGGDLITASGMFNQFGAAGNLLLLVLLGGQAVVSVIAINQLSNSIFSLLHDKVLDAAESAESLDDLKRWLEMTCNKRQHLLVATIGGVIAGLYATSLLNTRFLFFIGYGSTCTIIFFSIFSTEFLYLLCMILLFSGRLRRFDLILFRPDPSNSELIFLLSSKLNLVVYIVGVYAAVMTFIFIWSGFFTSAGIFLVLALWLPIIALFILNQTGLASIIRRAKWKTLNQIQARIEKLRASKSFGTPKTMDAIGKLMDFHDRVKATRNSAIDSNTIVNFINSLLLPLLAFLLGNLDKVAALF